MSTSDSKEEATNSDGGGASTTEEPPEPELTLEQRRILILRRITQEVMLENNVAPKKVKPKIKLGDLLPGGVNNTTSAAGGGGSGIDDLGKTGGKSAEELAALKAERSVRTLKVISDPKNATLYSMELERELVTCNKLDTVIEEVKKQYERNNTTIENVVMTLKKTLEESFFGCIVNVGVMVDAANSAIEFLSDPEYTRKATRQSSTCFECIDSQDIVVKVNSRAYGSDISALTEGETVVNVPLFGKGGPAGIIEILGMQSEGLTSLDNYERPTAPIEAMVRAKDYKFKKDLRVWRMPGQKTGGLIRGKKKKMDLDAGHIKVVCGKIYEIATEKNGVPYFGGARYSIQWEDGLLEEGLTQKEFFDLYTQTPQSLGSCTPLDEKLIKDLLIFGESVGETIENQRRKDMINKIRKKLNIPGLGDTTIVEITLDSVMAVLRGGRQGILVAFDEESKEYVELSSHYPAGKVSEKKYNVTLTEVIDMLKASKDPFGINILPDGQFIEWMAFQLKLPNDYKYKFIAKYRTIYVVFIRSKLPNRASASLDEAMSRDACRLLADTLIVAFIKETRLRTMKSLLKTLESSMFEWRKTSIEDICYNSCTLISQILPGADVYIGLLKEGGKCIYFMGSNNSSKMVGKSLMRGEGISFDILQNLETVILQPETSDKSKFLTDGSSCQVLYGKKYYPATIVKFAGHACYDIIYDFDKKVECGVESSRIVPVNSAFRVKKFSPTVQFPYVGIAIRNAKKCIGVLGVDTFQNVPKAPYDNHPDPNVLHFLESSGKIIGGAIDLQRKRQAIKVFNTITKNPNAEMHEVLDGAFDCLQSILFYLDGVCVNRAIYETTEDYFIRGQKKFVRDRGVISFDATNKVSHFDVHKSNLKPLQKINDKCVLMVCKLKPEVRGREGKIYLLTIDCTEPILQPDLEFLDTLQKIISSALQGLVARKALSELKFESLVEIKEICDNWRSIDRHKLFDMVSDLVQSIFFSANMYVGFLGIHNEEIKYVLANSHSDMKGKSLLRKKGNPYFLTFHAIDTNSRICVMPHTVELRDKLFYFGFKDKSDFPIIILPLLTHVDAIIGIFTIDSCEDPSTDGEKMDSTISYFSNVGNCLVTAVHGYRLADAREKLLEITRTSKSYRKGMVEIKRLLLNLIPFATRITDIVYRPLLEKSLKNSTSNEFLVLFHVVKSELLVASVKSPTLHIIWQGKTLFKVKIEKNEEQNVPFSFLIAKNVFIDQVQLQMVVRGTIEGGSEKEICKKSLGFHYIVNTPVNVMEHYLDSAFVTEVHVAKVQVVSKVYDPANIVALSITDIAVRGLPNTDTLTLTDAYVIIKWNDSIVYQTNVIDDNLDPHWENIEGNVEFSGSNYSNEVMTLEVWDSDLLGRGNFLGQITYKGKDLVNVFSGLDTWNNLKPLSSDHSGGNSVSDYKIQGRVKLAGYVMYSRDMNESQRKKELDVVGLGDSSSDAKDDAALEEKFQECELRVLQARNLLSKFTHPHTTSINPFITVFFNGEEIGRTGVVENRADPDWDEETFLVRAPESDLHNCLLLIEVHHMSASGKGEFLGCCEITSIQLVNLLSGNSYKRQWFDVRNYMGLGEEANLNICGEVKLGGRPMNVPIDGAEDDAIDLGSLEISILSATNILSPKRKDSKCITEMTFNGTLVLLSGVAESVLNPEFPMNTGYFSHPNSKGLLQSVLKVMIFASNESGDKGDLIAEMSLTSWDLVKLLGQKGCKTLWFPITVVANGASESEVKLRGGPANALDEFDDDGREIWFDILAATALSPANTTGLMANNRPNPYVLVYWNEKLVFKTVVVSSSSNPMWENQRALLRTPLIDGEENSLMQCKLRVVVFSKGPIFNTELGFVEIQGQELFDLVNSDYAQVRWLKLKDPKPLVVATTRLRTVSISNDSSASPNPESLPKPPEKVYRLSGGEIKIKIGNAGESHDPSLKAVEYKLQVISCENLMKADAFSSTDPFYTVEWNNSEIGRSETHSNDYNPVFDLESYIIRCSENVPIENQKLVVNIWDYNLTTGNEFLGQFLFTDELLLAFFSTPGPQTFALHTSADLTEDENKMVQGKVTLICSRVEVRSNVIISLKTVVLHVMVANNIGSTSKFHTGSDVFFKIIRKNDAEGSEEVEIYKSKVIAKTTDPDFNIEVLIKVPIDVSNWHEVLVRVELWDVRGDFLGCVPLMGPALSAILDRSGEDSLVPIEYTLQKLDSISASNQKHVQGTVKLAGGSSEIFAERKLKKISIDNILGGLSSQDPLSMIDSAGSPFSITIIRARDLGKADVLLQKSDPFCVLYWNNKEIGRTAVIDSNINPRWDDEVFSLNLPKDDNPSVCKMDILVYDKDPGEDLGDFLGMLTLTGGDLGNLLDPENGEMEYPLHSNPLFSPRSNKLVKGSIFISGKCQKFIEQAEAAAEGNEGGGAAGGGSASVGAGGSEKSDPSATYKYKVSLISAKGLANMGFFGRPSDPYVNVYWCNDKTPFATSKTVSGSNDPTFYETIILDLPKGKNSGEYVLRFHLLHKNTLKIDEFLGEVSFEGRALENLLNLGKEETSLLVKSSFFPENKQQNVKGSFKFRVQKVTAEELAASDASAACPVGMKDLELNLIAAAGLAKANTFGLSDPFCVVYWNGNKLGENPVIEETLDPVWEDDNSKFNLRVSEIFGYLPDDLKTKRGERWKDPKLRAYDDAIDNYVLTIDVWDWNQFGPGVFLGSVEIKGEEIQKEIAGMKVLRKWYDLSTTSRLPEKEQKLVQGKLQIMINQKDSGDDFDGKDLDIVVCSAKGLAKADTFGSADPYVKVRWNYKLLGKTKTIMDNLTPVWEDEEFKCRQPGYMNIEDCNLYLELWDWDAVGGGNFLGSLKIEGERLKEIVDTSNFARNWYELSKSEYLPESMQDLVQGEIEIQIGYSGKDYDNSDQIEKFEFHVFSAQDLARADGMFGLSDPYLLAKWNNREIGRTPYIDRDLNPEWNNQFFLFQYAAKEDPKKFSLLFEVWDHDAVGKGDFLGGYVLTGDELKDWLDEANDDTVCIRRTLKLTTVKHMDLSQQELVQGVIQVGFKKFREKQVASSVGKSLHMKFDSERELAGGQPLIDVSVISGTKLALQSGLVRSCNPFVKVTWMNAVIGQTPVADNNNPNWTNNNRFAIKMSAQAEKEEAVLLIDVFDKPLIGKDVFLGRVELSFWSLIRLQCGTFQFLLRPNGKNQIIRGFLTVRLDFYYPYWDSCHHVLATKLLRKIRIFSAEELPNIGDEGPSSKCAILFSGSIKAKTMVVTRNNNPTWPQTQCLILIDLKNPIEVTLQCIHVDIREKREICIGQAVIPFDYFLRPPKEPFLVSLGPPAKKAPSKYKFTVSGGILIQITEAGEGPAKMLPYSTKYEQSLCSYVVEDVSASTTGKQDPKDIVFDGALTTALENISFGTSCGINTIEAIPRSPNWIVAPIRDLGLRIGKKVTDVYGTKPGYRLALALERDVSRINISDVAMLEDIIFDVEQAMLQLRRKDISTVLRERALARFIELLEDYVKQPDFTMNTIYTWLVDTISRCIPGVSVIIGSAGSDFKSISYTCYETSSETYSFILYEGQGSDWDLIGRHPPRSVEINSIKDLQPKPAEKNAPPNKPILLNTFRPYYNTQFPRINVPLIAGDVATGFFTVENFDKYKGGYEAGFNDQAAVKAWLENVGESCGRIVYEGKEKLALRAIETFVNLWCCERSSLVVEILKQCFAVLNSCKLLEVWSVKPDPLIKSLAVKAPVAPIQQGRVLTISKIRIRKSQLFARKQIQEELEAKKLEIMPTANNDTDGEGEEKAPDSKSGEVGGEGKDAKKRDKDKKKKKKKGDKEEEKEQAGGLLGGLKSASSFFSGKLEMAKEGLSALKKSVSQEKLSEMEAESKLVKDKDNKIVPNPKDKLEPLDHSSSFSFNLNLPKVLSRDPIGEMIKNNTNFVCGLYYNGIEQVQIPLTKVLDNKNSDSYLEFQMVQVVITTERSVTMNLFEVDENLKIVNEYTGVVNFVSFEEKNMTVSLASSSAMLSSDFDAELEFIWPKGMHTEQSEVASFDLARLKSFEITCVSARDLLAADSNGFSDPFCEIFWYNKVIGKTKVINESLSPTWNESFKLQYIQGKSSMLAIDVYDMNFMGKGSILGRVEIPFSQLLAPPEGTIDLPLKHKMGLNAKKQSKVGGIITLKYTMDLYELQKDEEEETENSKVIVTIPRIVWAMNTPAIALTISHASDLAVANMFGGSSDPFVVVYLSNSSEPLFRTKVIDANLSPLWDETFVINLGVSLDPGSTTISDFPSLRLEVYDFNRIAKGEFLGMCEISPVQYCGRKGNEYRLQKNPKLKEKQNKLVQGSITCTFKLVDNVKVIQKQGYKFSKMNTLMPDMYLEVQVLRGRDLMVANRVGGKSDPYVKVFYNSVEYGETAYKKGTLDPSWQDEKFAILLNENNDYQIGELVLQVWDKDFFSEGDFMGEVRIPDYILLHPPAGNFDMELQNFRGQSKGKIKGKLVFKLNIRQQKQKVQIDPVDFLEVRPSQVALTPKAIVPFFDPNAEAQRQVLEKYDKKDKPKLQKIIDGLREKQKKYEDSPFAQSGLLPEVHLGQILSSYKREEHTILKIPLADWLFLPCNTNVNKKDSKMLIKNKNLGIDDASLSSNDQSVVERLADYNSDDETNLGTKKLADKELSNTAKKSGFGKTIEAIRVEEENEMLYIVARYDSGQLPRRDLGFLQSISKVIHQGLNIVDKRAGREKERKNLQLNITTLFGMGAENVEALYTQSMIDIETSLQSNVDLYLLDNSIFTLIKCKKETGIFLRNVYTDDFLQQAAKLCRHGYAIQYFQGSLFILNIYGQSLSQMALINLNLVEEEISKIEGADYVTSLYNYASRYYKNGCFVVPIMAQDELFRGIFVYHNLDTFPTAIYQMKLRNYNNIDIGKKSENEKAEIANKIFEVRGIEDGISQLICGFTKEIGLGITNAALLDIAKQMKLFNVHDNQTQLDAIKFLFRLVLKSYSSIREISIWCVDVNDILRSTEIIVSANGSADVRDVEENKGGFANLLKSLFKSKPKDADANLKPSSLILSDTATTAAAVGDVDKSTVASLGVSKSILAGCFGVEDPYSLMRSESEEISYSKWKEEKLYKDAKAKGKQVDQSYAIRRAEELIEKDRSAWNVLTPIGLLKPKDSNPSASATEAEETQSEVSDVSKSTVASSSKFPSRQNSVSSVPVEKVERITQASYKGKVFDEATAVLILKEIFRGGKQMKLKSFRLVTGHFLSSIGEDRDSRELLDEAFDPSFFKKKKEGSGSKAKEASRDSDSKKDQSGSGGDGGLGRRAEDLNSATSEIATNSNLSDDMSRPVGSDSSGGPGIPNKSPRAAVSPRSRDAVMAKSNQASPRSLGHIPGASNVAKSSSDTVAKSPRPSQAPLPAGPPPKSPRSGYAPPPPFETAAASVEDKSKPSTQTPTPPGGDKAETKDEKAKPGTPAFIKKRLEGAEGKDKKKKSKDDEDLYLPGSKKYFITARSHGLGSISGFGVGGDLLEKALGECSVLLDSVLRAIKKQLNEKAEKEAHQAKVAAKKLAKEQAGAIGDTFTEDPLTSTGTRTGFVDDGNSEAAPKIGGGGGSRRKGIKVDLKIGLDKMAK